MFPAASLEGERITARWQKPNRWRACVLGGAGIMADGGGKNGLMVEDSTLIRNQALTEARGRPVVTARGVCHSFGDGETRSQVLFDNTLTIGAGEVVILTGPSGSGKTTLLTLIGTLRQLQEGELVVLGHRLNDASAAERIAIRRRIGYIFQHHNLFGSLTAMENVRMAAGLADGPVPVLKQRCEEILVRLGLGQRMDNIPARLSGGQRQRVAIARALVNRPRLVLADEPTAALDVESGAVVMKLIRELADGPERSTVLIVTHDHHLLAQADRIVKMEGGRIVSNVRPAESIRICRALKSAPDLKLLKLGEATLVGLAERMSIRHCEPGETVIREGGVGHAYYLVGSGVAQATVKGRHVRDINPSDGFGEIMSISHRLERETVKARTELELFVLTEADALEVLDDEEGLEERVRLYYMSRP